MPPPYLLDSQMGGLGIAMADGTDAVETVTNVHVGYLAIMLCLSPAWLYASLGSVVR